MGFKWGSLLVGEGTPVPCDTQPLSSPGTTPAAVHPPPKLEEKRFPTVRNKACQEGSVMTL